LRLVDGWDTDLKIKQPKVNELAINWYINKFNNTLESIDSNFESYRISDVLMSSYKLIWDDFCSWFLEILKPEYGKKIDQKSKSELIKLFIKNLKIIHPFMPFLSEEIYHNLQVKVSKPITISSWPNKEEYDIQLINNFEITKEIISQIRNYRKEKNIPFKTPIKLYCIPSNKPIGNIDVIKKIGFVEDIIESEKADFALVKSFIIKNYEFFIPLDEGFDKDSEIKKLNKELEYNIGFLKSVDSKLKNKNFISNAPKEIIDKEKQKIIDTEQKIKSIKKSISELS
jgi:valyl-tRNA synthetase